MLAPLTLPGIKASLEGEAGMGTCSEADTPRDPPSPMKSAGSLPSSPSARKTKSRAARSHFRANSLKDAKVLLVSDMHRTESVLDPSLFQYHQHFETPWQLVGKTHLSEVFRVRHRSSGEVFAVKRSRRRFRSKLQRERCLREIRAVAALPSHPNIVNQYRAWQEGGHFYIQMAWCEGGNLAQKVHQACQHGACVPDEQLWATACQAAHGLHFLHSHGVLHLDVKPENIYLASGTWRIGDFGLAVARDSSGSMDWEEGDGDYVAPELLQVGGEPSPAADIFSLGATLFECATGGKLPRSEGWAAGDAERLEVLNRPAAFVQLLRAMLQFDPALRPCAEQVLGVVLREQPAVAAAAAEAVAAAAAEAQAAATTADRQAPAPVGSVPLPVDQAAAAIAMAPSPFMQHVQPAGNNATTEVKQQRAQAVAAAAGSPAFSFDVPRGQPRGLAFTPGQPLRPRNGQRSGGGVAGEGAPPGTAVKVTPAGRARMGGRWAPALSPLISEGALTPGAAAALAGFTPGSSSEGGATPVLGPGSSSGSRRQAAGTPMDMWRPAPLQLPPQTAPTATASGGSSGGLPSTRHPSSSGTQDSRDGWRLSRRDIISPDSDAINGSLSDSDYSYSCGTGKTLSDMDFADALSPASLDLGRPMSFVANGPSLSSGTPDSLPQQEWQEGEAGSTPSSDLHLQNSAAAAAVARPQSDAAAGAPRAGPPVQAAPSLAWDLHTSPEFLMQLPPGSPDSLSRSSSLDDTASLPSRAMSVRRFPTLDNWGSHLHQEGSGCSKAPSRADSLAALAAQRFTNTFAVPEQPAPAAVFAPSSGDGPSASVAVPTGGRGQRKRQHSSRRTLIAALSRDNSVASSIEGMQPLGKARHIMPDSGPSSPCADGSRELPPGLSRLLNRSCSSLKREAAAAATAGLAQAAAKVLTAATVPSPGAQAGLAAPGAGVCGQPFCFDGVGSDPAGGCDPLAASPLPLRSLPQSPLHARLTCMKLRDSD